MVETLSLLTWKLLLFMADQVWLPYNILTTFQCFLISLRRDILAFSSQIFLFLQPVLKHYTKKKNPLCQKITFSMNFAKCHFCTHRCFNWKVESFQCILFDENLILCFWCLLENQQISATFHINDEKYHMNWVIKKIVIVNNYFAE